MRARTGCWPTDSLQNTVMVRFCIICLAAFLLIKKFLDELLPEVELLLTDEKEKTLKEGSDESLQYISIIANTNTKSPNSAHVVQSLGCSAANQNRHTHTLQLNERQ